MKIQFLRSLILPLALLGLSASAQKPIAAQGRLIVANKGDATIGIVDPVAGRQLLTVPEGGITGHEVAVSPDGRTAYVPIYGNAGVATAGTNGRNMVVIDLKSGKVTGNVDFGHGVRPHYPVYDRVNHVLYVTTELDKTVTIIDPATLKIIGAIPTSQAQSHVLAISHDGRRGYTANVGPGTLSVLDLKTRKLITVVPISGNTQRVSVSMDDKLVFTADQTKPQLAVVDATTNKLKTWVPLPAIGYGTSPTPDGHWLLVAIPSKNQVAVVDLAKLTLVKTIDVAKEPQAIVVRPDSKEAYASCRASNQVAVIDLSSWKVRFIDTGKGVDGMAWAK
ncbi:MAG TPA: cytochrome D1 domain-containing protein [Acidobacteriaceae bacterium]